MNRFFYSVAVMFVVVTICMIPNYGQSFDFFSGYKKVQAKNGEVRFPVKTFMDGKARHYSYKDGKVEVKFFVVQSKDGVVRAAFDACDICFPEKKGYSQDGDYMICNNCGRKFHSSRVNVVEGGCNPAPLKREKRGGDLVIKVEDILLGARFF